MINNEEFHKAVNPRKEERQVMPKPKTPIPVAIFMTDEEIQAHHKKKQKEDLLEQLIAATNRPFSVKNLGTKKETAKERSLPTSTLSLDDSSNTLPKPMLQLDDDEFQTIRDLSMAYGSESPIEKVTDYALGEFRLEDLGVREEEENRHYKSLFKQEQAMLSEILRDVSEQAKWANNRLKEMTKKSSGYGGVAKTYPDLISAANSLNHTRFSIVTKMADLKKTLVDLEMKRAKEMGTDEKDNKDTLADQFFAQIVSNRKQFMESAMTGAGYSQLPGSSAPELPYQGEDEYNNEPNFQGGYQEAPPVQMRSITTPLYPDEETAEELYQDGGNNEFDPYGYIHNENRDVHICIQRFPDGRLEFVALDDNNESVDDYELPDEDLLLSLEIRPFSNYASDEFGRRYRIIDIDSDGMDISDV